MSKFSPFFSRFTHSLNLRLFRQSFSIYEVFHSYRTLEYLILAGSLLLISIIRIKLLAGVSTAGDEPFFIFHTQLSVPVIFAHLTKGNNLPILKLSREPE